MKWILILFLLTGCAAPHCQQVKPPKGLLAIEPWPSIAKLDAANANDEQYVRELENYTAALAVSFEAQRRRAQAIVDWAK